MSSSLRPVNGATSGDSPSRPDGRNEPKPPLPLRACQMSKSNRCDSPSIPRLNAGEICLLYFLIVPKPFSKLNAFDSHGIASTWATAPPHAACRAATSGRTMNERRVQCLDHLTSAARRLL